MREVQTVSLLPARRGGVLAMVGAFFRDLNRPTVPLTGAALAAAFGGMPSSSGRVVSPNNALQIAAVYACVRVIAETVATLPVHVYRRLPQGRELVTTHPAARILEQGPNDDMSIVDYLEALVGHVLLWGNAYSEVNRTGDGILTDLQLMDPSRTHATRGNGYGRPLVYESVDLQGRPSRRAAARTLHVRGFGFDGITGYSPVALAREPMGMAMATEEYGARFFANDSRPGGVLQMDGTLSDDGIKRLKASWEAAHSALYGQAHKVAVLENGLRWQSIGMPNDDAQWLDTRKFTRSEIAGIYRVPPHLIGDLERATFSNIEQQGIEFSTLCISPWAVRIEKALNRALFTENERGRLFVKFNLAGLVRGDLKSRYDAYAVGRQNGWLSANDIRELEDMNPVDGGDAYLVNGNMIPVDQAGQKPAVPPPPPAPAAAGGGPPNAAAN